MGRKYTEKYTGVVREQGKTSLEEARKLVTAWVGATDAAYKRLLAELRDPGTRTRVAKLQEQVKGGYADLAKRGEKVIEDLRQRPETRTVFSRAEQVLRRGEKRVEHAEKQVTGQPAKGGKTTASKPANDR